MSAPTVALGDVADFIRGVTYKPADLMENFSEGSIVCMRTANIQKTLDESSLLSIPRGLVKNDDKMLREGDLLVSTANSWNLVGKCCWVPPLKYAAAAGGFIAALRGDQSKVDPRYLYHWFSSPDTQSNARNCGRQTTNISNMDIGRCLALKIPVPPLPEQRRIAAILDKADALRAKRREAIAKLDQLLQSVFQEMFGDPVTITKRWNMTSLGECVPAINVGHVGPTSHGYVDDGVGVVFLRTQNVRPNSVVMSDVRYISQNFHDQLKKSKLCVNDVLVSRVGANRGMAAVVPQELDGANCANIVIVRSGDVLCPKYLSTLINSPYGELTLLGDSVGAAQGVINVGTLARWKVPVPALHIQKRFSAAVELVEHQQKRKRAQFASLEALYRSLQIKAFEGAL